MEQNINALYSLPKGRGFTALFNNNECELPIRINIAIFQ